MDRYVLDTPALRIRGKDVLGRPSSLLLERTKKLGWYWHVRGEDVELSPAILVRRFRHLQLQHGSHSLHVFEHLGPLRFSGLDGIRIICESGWLPYDGSGAIFWDAVKPHLEKEGSLLYVSLEESCKGLLGGHAYGRRVRLHRAEDECLSLQIEINYPGLGTRRERFVLPDMKVFERIARTKSPAWPPLRTKIAVTLLENIIGWPHRSSMTWSDHPEVLREFAGHRALDLLGALSVCIPAGKMLSGSVFSHCAGHAQDRELVQQIETLALLEEVAESS